MARDMEKRRAWEREYSKTSDVKKASRDRYKQSHEIKNITIGFSLSSNEEKMLYEKAKNAEPSASSYIKSLIKKDMEE